MKLALVLLLLAGVNAFADDTAKKDDPDKLNVVFGAFVDTYYGYDFNSPPNIDRTLQNGNLFGTQFIRNNEFNINLAYVDAKLTSDRLRGRLALQAGTSVQANYAGESAGLGVVKGPVPAEFLQEAVAGYRIADGLWIDGGIFFSHIGFESFISRENWNYTRSMMSEYSPYYQAGVKLSYQFNPAWSGQFLILNGWQNIYDIDAGKALGMEVSYAPSDRLTLTYNNILVFGSLSRFFNDFISRFNLTDNFQIAGLFDIGIQPTPSGVFPWYTGAILTKWQIIPLISLGARAEFYIDRNQVIVAT
ncbi:MAG: outer membrane beta-barrel protein, partial [Bdellovibrionota bacterium]